jgi:hypothetical protein
VPTEEGGILSFTFDTPVFFQDIGLIDSDESSNRLEITYSDGITEFFYFDSFGDNAVQRVIVKEFNVIKVEMIFQPKSGAVAEINFCRVCTEKTGHIDSLLCQVAGNFTINALQRIERIDFENLNEEEALWGWTGGSINHDEQASFSKFLGVYAQNLEAPFKTFTVPMDAETIFIELDFYKIDNWASDDTMSIFVDGERIALRFDIHQTGGAQNGITPLGIGWDSIPVSQPENLGFLPSNDQKHHITIKIPSTSQLFSDGKLRVVLQSGVKHNGGEGYAGWDNFEVNARFKCEDMSSDTPISSIMNLPTKSPTERPVAHSPS